MTKFFEAAVIVLLALIAVIYFASTSEGGHVPMTPIGPVEDKLFY